MLTTEDFVAWLQSQYNTLATGLELTVAFQPGPFVWETPDRLVTPTILGGAGYSGEELYDDRPSCQMRTRGAQGSQSDAEDLAWLIDRLLTLDTTYPVSTPAGALIKVISRTGGAPAPLPGNPDSAQRYTYTANYLAIVGTLPP